VNLVERLLRQREVIGVVGLSRTTIWRLEKARRFPQRRRLGKQAVGWEVAEATGDIKEGLWIRKERLAPGRRGQL
jgi:predicted DNA-binding transcriptional regulator AlpA